jgi:hypothetical protein
VGGLAGGRIGGGGATVAGYEGGGEEGRDGGNRKFCAIFRMPASAFSSAESRLFKIILLEPAEAKGHSISDTINRIVKIKFFSISPSVFIIRPQGY